MEFMNLEDEIYIEKQNRHDFDDVVHIFDEWLECSGLSDNYDSYWVSAYGSLLLDGVPQKITATCKAKHFNTEYNLTFVKGRLMQITRIE
jgi:hypothetical protein